MKTYWDIYYYSGGWVSDGKIPTCGVTELSENYESNADTILLADGNLSRSSSENKISPGVISFTWPRQVVTSAFRTKMKALHGSGAGIRIDTHVTDVSLEGYIDRLDDMWQLTGIPQEYAFSIEMQIMDVDE